MYQEKEHRLTLPFQFLVGCGGADATRVLGGSAEDFWEVDPFWPTVYDPDSHHNKQKISKSGFKYTRDTQMPETSSLG